MSKFLPLIATTILLIYAIFSLTTKLYFNYDSKNWNAVNAIVTSLSFPNKGVVLEYKYELDGKKFSGQKVSYLRSGTLEDRDILQRQKNIALGDSIKIYVDRKNSDRSVYLRKNFNFNYIKLDIVLIGFCFVAIYIFSKRMSLKQKGIA